jgi:hypothetical protein
MYKHKTVRINYTSYDVIRQQDVINPSTPHRFVLLPAEFDEDAQGHPFLYAKILGVYHANVIYNGRPPHRMEFVHVRWLYYDYDRPGGWNTRRLDHVSYETCRTDQDILDSFDFVDPKDIIRAVHLIPNFCLGISRNLLNTQHSIGHDNPEFGDWQHYYVNR